MGYKEATINHKHRNIIEHVSMVTNGDIKTFDNKGTFTSAIKGKEVIVQTVIANEVSRVMSVKEITPCIFINEEGMFYDEFLLDSGSEEKFPLSVTGVMFINNETETLDKLD